MPKTFILLASLRVHPFHCDQSQPMRLQRFPYLDECPAERWEAPRPHQRPLSALCLLSVRAAGPRVLVSNLGPDVTDEDLEVRPSRRLCRGFILWIRG
jgi:hypothetical protein